MTVFEWEIENLRMAPLLPGTSVQSPPFCVEESKTFEFYLKLLPRHFEVNLFLWRCDKNSKNITLQYKLQIQSGEIHNVSTFRNEFRKPGEESSCWEDQDFLSFSRFQCGNRVKILCEILWHNNFEDIDEDDLKDLSCAYARLLDTGAFSDVKFRFAGKVFNIHRAILEARSPALAKAIENKDFAKECSQICRDKTIFQKCFQYLYSAKLDNRNDLNDNIYALFEKIDKSILKRMSNSHAFHSSVKTLFQVKRYYFEWSVENFIEVISNRKLYYSITEGNQWSWMKLIMFLDPQRRDTVKFILRRLNNSISTCIHCKIDVKGSSSSSIEDLFSGHIFSNEIEWEVSQEYQIDSLREHLQNDALTFAIILNVGDGRYCTTTTDTRFLNITSDINNMYYLRENFKELFKCSTFSDIILIAGEEVFQAHKAILSARSLVFHKMFQNDKSVGQNGAIIIDDIRSGVLSTMLSYIYCGQLKSLDFDFDFAVNLYYAASNYQIPRLKEKCSVILQSVLNAENAAMILILADTHGDENLKTLVLDFVCSDASTVSTLHSSEWKDIISSRPHLLSEILQRTCRVANG